MRPDSVYFLFDAVAGKDVCVRFEPLTESDRATLNEAKWREARFRDVWLEWARHGVALKLTRCDGEEQPILGLIRPGMAPSINGRAGALRDSLLETSPAYRHGTAERRYRGIGRVLGARLVAESNAQGAEGRVLVRPVRDSIPFYRNLGFRDTPILAYLKIETREAETLLQACTPSSIE